jgi:adenylate cyclase
MELAPDDFVAHWTLGRIHFTNDQFDQAYDLFRRVIELKPGLISGYADLAMTCDGLGRADEARAARNQMLDRLPNYILQNPDDSRARMFYAVTLAESGRKADAIREGSNALEISPDDPMMLYNCACLHARLDEPRRALELLRHAISRGQLTFGWMRHDPGLGVLRDNAEFIELTAGQRAGLARLKSS